MFAVLGDLPDRDQRDAMFRGEELEEREARRRAVVVQHLADDGARRESRKPGEVDRGLGVAAPFEYAAGTRAAGTRGPVG